MPPRKKKTDPSVESIQQPEPEPVEQPARPLNESLAVAIYTAWHNTVIQEYKRELQLIQQQISDQQEQAKKLETRLESYVNPKSKPWYTSWGIWLAILLTIVVLYLSYAFYMSETGHKVTLPSWFIQWLNSVIPN